MNPRSPAALGSPACVTRHPTARVEPPTFSFHFNRLRHVGQFAG